MLDKNGEKGKNRARIARKMLKITAKSLKSMKFDCVEFEKSLLSFMLKIGEKKRDISENYERKMREIDEKITENRGEVFEKRLNSLILALSKKLKRAEKKDLRAKPPTLYWTKGAEL